MEDIANTEQRPKIDVYEDYIFISLKMLTYYDKNQEVFYEELSLILMGVMLAVAVGLLIYFKKKKWF